MNTLGVRIIIGILAASAFSMLARRAQALTTSGAIAAAVTGSVAVAAGWAWSVMLMAYFLSSSLLSRWGTNQKAARTGGVIEKGGPRDAAQVAANGATFVGAALGFLIAPPFVAAACLALGAGTLAASAADTWATEIGTLKGGAPRSVLNWRPVPVGTSGAVSIAGTLASVVGAAFIAALAFLLGWSLMVAVGALVGGIVGALLDSLIGATVQARRHCPRCDSPTEQAVHRCGSATRHVGGIEWMDNDLVNLLASTAGGLVAMALAG